MDFWMDFGRKDVLRLRFNIDNLTSIKKIACEGLKVLESNNKLWIR